ncbi:MAG TPA: tyrosine-type recombinase/integrase [Bacteroidota bacterium]|nr:tyrosine-type recombinase/integrase [Bacteroidota bacterium]
MFLRKRSNGYYHVSYRNDQGRWTSISTGTKSKSEANEFFSDLKERLAQRKQVISFSEYAGRYLDYSLVNHSPASTEKVRLVTRRFLEIIGDKVLDRITPFDIEGYKTQRAKLVSPVSVNIELRTLKAMFSMAVKWDVVEKSPFRSVRFIRVPERSPVFLSSKDFERLLSVIQQDWLKAICIFAANTGLRRGELINLRWISVDLERRLIKVQNSEEFSTKSKKERIIPLNLPAVKVLMSLPHRGEYVFTDISGAKLDPTTVSKSFREAAVAAELDSGIKFHSLRHTFASWLIQNGASIYEVQKLLGHSSVVVTQIYAHLRLEELETAVNRINVNLN